MLAFIVSYHFMRQTIIIISLFASTLSFGQAQKIIGIYRNLMPRVQVTFNQDSTFEYVTKEQHPTFYRWEAFLTILKNTLTNMEIS